MRKQFPDLVDPFLCVEKGRRWRGKLPLAEFPRLSPVILNPEDEVTIDLSFARQGRIAAVTGSVQASLALTCQRCLESVGLAVDSAISLGLVTSIDEGDRLPEPYEPLLVEEGNQLLFNSIVEDELILAIPDIPRHGQCHALKVPDAEHEAGGKVASNNPFQKLVGLKDKH